eukprot:TRINITY_DN57729_c0_g1_i1.p1 TRINITY_DN57729_c0_g1~~TRINITY_DN57729_c0_g1_i1.p1  ORF type:complete len:238 (+),score=25.72 TRINITY_DN57729_c0_g1_i1:64-777(+)
MNIFFLSMSSAEAAKMHADIHIVKMIVETAQLLCNVHHRAREESSHCSPPFIRRNLVPYRESASGHRKLGSMIWVAESLGNYRWAVRLGLALCREYNRGRGRAAGKTSQHKTQKVLEWLRDHEPNFNKKRRTPVAKRHLAMPDRFKKAKSSVEAYRDYYYSKRRTMPMQWPKGRVPEWWEARKSKRKPQTVATVSPQEPELPVQPAHVPQRRLKRKTAPEHALLVSVDERRTTYSVQ